MTTHRPTSSKSKRPTGNAGSHLRGHSRLGAIVSLFRELILPYHRRHLFRMLLTLVGVVIGTQVVVAVQLLNRSVVGSFEATVETIAGSADLQITNASSGVPEEVVDEIFEVPGVASASGLLQGVLVMDDGELTVFGVDLFADQSVREAHFPPESIHIDDEFIFANARDSIAVALPFLAARGLGLGDTMDVQGPFGPATLTVRGALDPVGPAKLFGGAVAVVDLFVAQDLFVRKGLVDQVDIELAPGADVEATRARIAGVVGGRGEVMAPRERASGLQGMLGNLQTFLTLMSFQAILVGIFLVYHALRTAVVHRRRDFALARALGYRRRDLSRAIILEAACFGVAGSLVGVVVGAGLAHLALDAVRDAIGAIYERSGSSVLALEPSDVVTALLLGTGTAMLAALVPMREAARVPIIRYVRPADTPEDATEKQRPVALRALCAALVGLLFFFVKPPGDTPLVQTLFISGGLGSLAIAFALLIPAVLSFVLRLLRPLVRRWGSCELNLGVESVARFPARRRGTIAPIMVAFALVLLAGSMVESLRMSILGWVDQTLAADLYVTPTPQLPLPSGGTFPAATADGLRELAEISDIGGSRLIYVDLGDRSTVLRTLDTRHAFGRLEYPVVSSIGSEDRDLFASGRGVLVADNLASRAGIRIGDTLSLNTPSGARSFTVVRIVTDFTLDIGAITIDDARYRELWRDSLVNVLYVWAEPGSDLGDLRNGIRGVLPPGMPASILTSGQFKEGVASALDDALGLTYAVELVAILIAVIGVINFFLVEVSDRRREIGLLLAVSLRRSQLIRAFLTEAAIIGAVGGLLAIVYGLPISYLVATRSTRMISGWSLDFRFPAEVALASVVVACLVAVLAALGPLRRITRERVSHLLTME